LPLGGGPAPQPGLSVHHAPTLARVIESTHVRGQGAAGRGCSVCCMCVHHDASPIRCEVPSCTAQRIAYSAPLTLYPTNNTPHCQATLLCTALCYTTERTAMSLLSVPFLYVSTLPLPYTMTTLLLTTNRTTMSLSFIIGPFLYVSTLPHHDPLPPQ
jgi:hypothetical protein